MKYVYYGVWIILTIFSTVGLAVPETCSWNFADCMCLFFLGSIIAIVIEKLDL